MKLIINTDGGSRGNPGPSGIGVVAQANGSDVYEHSSFIGTATNNVAEYTAALKSIEWVVEYLESHTDVSEIEWRLDSKLVVEQLSRNWKIKDANLRTYAQKCWELLEHVSIEYSFTYVPRAENSEADALVNQALDSAQL